MTFESADGHQDLEMLRLLASLEQGSEHPLAGSIVAGAKERTLNLAKTDHFQSVTGKGVHRHGGGPQDRGWQRETVGRAFCRSADAAQNAPRSFGNKAKP